MIRYIFQKYRNNISNSIITFFKLFFLIGIKRIKEKGRKEEILLEAMRKIKALQMGINGFFLRNRERCNFHKYLINISIDLKNKSFVEFYNLKKIYFC